jgi:transcription initiation factor TFIIIB Brf1 subunit/transcription initiation factor TFIIB
MPIRACPECSSDRLVFPKRGETAFACEDCGWAGQPEEFPSWSAWQESRLARARARVVTQ